MPGGASNTRMELKNKSGYIIPLYNADHLEKQLRSHGRPTDTFRGKVNSLRYTCRGRTSISGWFLTDCRSINDLLPEIYSGTGHEEVSLTLVDDSDTLESGNDRSSMVGGGGSSSSSNTSHEIKKLYVINAYAVTGVIRRDINKPDEAGSRMSELQRGGDYAAGDTKIDNHDNQMYVLQVVDYRYYSNILGGKVSNYNVRRRLWDEDSDTSVYSVSDGFTWQSMLIDIWGSGGVGLSHGSANYPTLGPFNYQFWGVTAFDALHKVLDDIDHTLIRKLDGTADVADMATYDPTSSNEREEHKGDLIEVSNDLTAPVLAEKIFVIFPKWDYQFQTSAEVDEVTPQDYWHNRPIWYEERETATLISSSSKLDYWEANHQGTVTTQPGSFDILHDGMIAQFDPRPHGSGSSDSFITDGGPTPSNNSDITDHATARATAYIEARLNGDNAIFREVYRGFIPFTPTRDISCITWKNSGGGAVTVIESVGRSFDSKFIATGTGSSEGSGGGETSPGYDLKDSSSRRVSQEFPGSPDHARLSEPVLRWAIVETKAEAAPGVRVNCDVYYGLEASGSITFTDTGNRDILVTNISKTATMPSGSRVMAYWNEQIREWVTNWYDFDWNLLGGDICAITTARGAVTNYTYDNCFDHIELLRANRDSLLRSFKRTPSGADACVKEEGYNSDEALEMLISIDPAPAYTAYGGGYVIGSGASNTVGKVRWTEAPEIGKHLVIGSTVNSILATPAFVAFNANGRANTSASGLPGNFTLMMKVNPVGYLISTQTIATVGALTPVAMPATCNETDPADATMIFPNNDASFRPGMHMSVKETGNAGSGSDNNCLQMRWTSPGVWGYIDVQADSNVDHADSSTQSGGVSAGGYNYRLHFDDGICVKIERVAANGEDGAGQTIHESSNYLGHRVDTAGADCSYSSYSPPNPCD